MVRYQLLRPFHDENIVIETDSRSFIENLHSFYGDFLQPVNHLPTISIREKGSDALVKCPEGEFHSKDAMVFLSEYLFEHTTINKDFFAIHGAAVEYNGKAFILAAPTTGGKTTLTAYLLHHGFGYLTDDCGLVEKNTLLLHPYAKPLHLREGGMAILRQFGIDPPAIHVIRKHIDRFVWTPENVTTRPTPLGSIFFIERGEENHSVILSQKQSIALLMKSPVAHLTVNAEHLSFLAKLSCVGCEKLCYSDMSYVAQRIQESAVEL